MTHKGMQGHLARTKVFIQILTETILSPRYKRGSRARWVCVLRSLLRIHGGLLALVLWGARRHLNLVLWMGPFPIHLLATVVHSRGGNYAAELLPLVESYVGPLEKLAGDCTPVTPDDLGISYVR
jgi:hypothetical protein